MAQSLVFQGIQERSKKSSEFHWKTFQYTSCVIWNMRSTHTSKLSLSWSSSRHENNDNNAWGVNVNQNEVYVNWNHRNNDNSSLSSEYFLQKVFSIEGIFCLRQNLYHTFIPQQETCLTNYFLTYSKHTIIVELINEILVKHSDLNFILKKIFSSSMRILFQKVMRSLLVVYLW